MQIWFLFFLGGGGATERYLCLFGEGVGADTLQPISRSAYWCKPHHDQSLCKKNKGKGQNQLNF